MSRCRWPLSLSMLVILLCLERVLRVLLRVPPLPLLGRLQGIGDVGVEAVELADDVLPNSRCVRIDVSGTAESHHGQEALRISHPWSRNFSGQFARCVCSSHDRTNSYQRWLQGWVDTFNSATHMLGICWWRWSCNVLNRVAATLGRCFIFIRVPGSLAPCDTIDRWWVPRFRKATSVPVSQMLGFRLMSLF